MFNCPPSPPFDKLREPKERIKSEIKMNIQEELLKEHSKAQTTKIATYIGNDADKFKELMDLFLGKEQLLNQRSAWVVSTVFEKQPQLILPFLPKLIANLHRPVHDAVKRNTLKIVQHISIPDNLQGEVCQICFPLLQANDTAIAIKVFAMTVIKNICKEQPDLKNELQLILEDQLPHASKGFIARAKKTLKELAAIR